MFAKSKLRKMPKIRVTEDLTYLGGAPIFFNEIRLSRLTLLDRWEKGELETEDVEATLAHEFGHRIDFSKKLSSFEFKYGLIKIIYLALGVLLFMLLYLNEFFVKQLVNQLGLSNSLFALFPIVAFPSFLIIVFAIWILLFPWVLRRTSIPIELKADENAIEYRLIEPQQMVQSILKQYSSPKASPNSKMKLDTFYNWLIHPMLSERLRNLNFQINNFSAKQTKDKGIN